MQMVKNIPFGSKSTAFHFSGGFPHLKKLCTPATTVLITDENILAAHKKHFKGWHTIAIEPGEENKVQATADIIIRKLIKLHAGRSWTLVGVGGGVVTDITGYVASVFLRGINFGFIPTSLLAMVDASIGGKNGIDVGVYKNMVGTINQPSFLLYDVSLLKTLPDNEWRNGFAEIIKHAAILDEPMFKELEKKSLSFYKKNKSAVLRLVQRNALLKAKIVKEDEFEKGRRKLLNFGHTLAHALEKKQELMHGEAVSIGMAFAARLSKDITKFKSAERLLTLLHKYGLPVEALYDRDKTFEILISDKKREGEHINFILLQKIGKAVIQKLSLNEIYKAL